MSKIIIRKYLIKKIHAQNNKPFFYAESMQAKLIKVFYDQDQHHKIKILSNLFVFKNEINYSILELQELETVDKDQLKEYQLISIK